MKRYSELTKIWGTGAVVTGCILVYQILTSTPIEPPQKFQQIRQIHKDITVLMDSKESLVDSDEAIENLEGQIENLQFQKALLLQQKVPDAELKAYNNAVGSQLMSYLPSLLIGGVCLLGFANSKYKDNIEYRNS